ncbi:mitochondrial ribosomal protein S21 [Brevipalpus obovatus]|uniref:mitochondrial ribosomal protein S21 n=1 Tax=Brevipalpus obovatus TaxID=246614 RepID=UPI003D9FA48C
MKPNRYLIKTVLVKDGQIELAFKGLNRILSQEGMFDIFRRTRRYEKPTAARRRYNYERCSAIYEEDMARKISFLMRKNRADPFPGRDL